MAKNNKIKNQAEKNIAAIASEIPSTSLELNTEGPQWKKYYKITLALLLVLMLAMSFFFGLSGDEVDMSEYGKAILRFYTSFGADQTVFNMPAEFDRDHILKYYGGFYDTICAIITPLSPLDLFTTRHLLNAFMGFLAIYFMSKIVIKLLGYQSAFFAILLMFLSPFFLGHAMNNPKDIPFAAFYIMAIYGMIRLFDKMPNASKKDYLFAILPIGFAMASRVGGILLFPEMLVLVFLLWYFRKNNNEKNIPLSSYAKTVAIVLPLAYAVGCLLWPYGLVDPLNNPLDALKQMTNLSVGIGQIFEGNKIMSTELPWYYLPKIFSYTNTFALLIGLALMFLFILQFRKNKNAALLYFLAFTFLFPFAYIIYSKSNVFHAWRHTLFIFPSAVVCAIYGWYALAHLIKNKNGKVIAFSLLTILLFEPLFFIASTFPNTVTYYNALAGGVSKAYNNFEMDYYYNSLKQSADWFLKNELPKWKDKADTPVVVTNAVHLLPKYFPKDARVKFEYVRYYEKNNKLWDYAIFHRALIPLPDIQNKTWLPANATLQTANVYGNALCAVIKRLSKDDTKGLQFYQQNQNDSALYYLKKYADVDKENLSVLNAMGQIYLSQNNTNEAEKYVKLAASKNPGDFETRSMLGLIALNKNDYGNAKNIFAQLLQDQPNYLQAHYYIGICQMQNREYENALNSFNTASQIEQLRPNCYKFMGDCFMALGNKEQANKMYSAAGLQ